MCRRYLADRGVEMDEAPQLFDHLAAGGDRRSHVVPGDPGLGQEGVHRLGHGPQVAPPARNALARAARVGRGRRLGAAVEAVDQIAVGRKEHGLQRGGTNINAEEQRAVHDEYPQDGQEGELGADKLPLGSA